MVRGRRVAQLAEHDEAEERDRQRYETRKRQLEDMVEAEKRSGHRHTRDLELVSFHPCTLDRNPSRRLFTTFASLDENR